MYKQVLELVARILQNLPYMSPEVMQGWIDNPKALKKFLAGLAPPEVRLTTLTPVRVTGNVIDPHKFFRDRGGLLPSDNFNDCILAGASKSKVSTVATTIGYANLVQDANDAEIGGELPEGYVFEGVDTFLVHLATLIDGQWGGGEGKLLNDGHANIFNVRVNGAVVTVEVDWAATRRLWRCFASRHGGLRLDAGSRVFSATVA